MEIGILVYIVDQNIIIVFLSPQKSDHIMSKTDDD